MEFGCTSDKCILMAKRPSVKRNLISDFQDLFLFFNK